MTINDAITKLRVLLGAENEVVSEVTPAPSEEVSVSMADATLVDGTEVFTEGEMVVGAVLYVKVEEGDAPFAPEGIHETTDGLLVTVGMNGVIEAIDTLAPVEETPAPSEEAAPAEAAPAEFNAEDLLSGVADIIKPYQEELKNLNERLNVLTERFNEVADLPAATPIKRNFMEDVKASKAVAEARYDRLVSIRNKKS